MLKRAQSRFFLPVIALIPVFALVLSACGPTGTPTTSDKSGKPVNGGVWVDDFVNEPDSLIPNASVQTYSFMVDQALYAPLFVGDSYGKIIPGIVTELPTTANGGISSDLKTWTFHLRPNLQWSDGQPLNAEDVDFTWRLWTNKNFAAASTVGYRLIQSAAVSADKLSITFHLSAPFAPFLAVWTDGARAPLPRHHFQNIPPEQIKKMPDNLNPTVTSGPFKMTESKPGDHYTLIRNSKYYRAAEGLPHLDRVVFRLVGNQNTILKDLQSGSVHSAWFLDVTKMKSYQELSNYNLLTTPSASYEALHFNLNNPALKDVKVRQAIAMSVNADELIRTARQGQAIPQCTDHSQVYQPGYQPDAPCPKFDLNGANTLLDQAGWLKDPDGVRTKGGLRLEFQYSSTQGNLWRQEDEVLNQASAAKVGIKLDIQNYPSSTFFSTFLGGGQPGKYDIAEWASAYTYDANDETNLACSQIPPHGANFNFYCNSQLDSLFAKEQATADPGERQQVFNQIHQVLLTDYPIFPMYALKDIEISKKGTHNYHPGPFGASETVNIWDWWCDGGKCPE